jgi:hypothetical protein
VINLSEIESFGSIDATSDAVLLQSFEEHPAYKAAVQLTHPIVLGRKGSGKSAIFKIVTRDPEQDMVSAGVAFTDYPWAHHAKQKQDNVPDEECFRESWKFFIGLMFCKLVVQHASKLSPAQRASSEYRTIETFIVDSYGADLRPDRVFTPGRQLKLSGRLSTGIFQAEGQMIDVEHLPRYYAEINRNLFDVLISVIPKKFRFVLCFDELDIGFDPKDELYLLRLIGLIRATKYAHDRFSAEGSKSGVILLLRDDIWHALKFEDKNKLTQSIVKEIKWTAEGGSASLKKLMEKRFSSISESDNNVGWDDIFESQTMANFKTKLAYMAERGLLRPRDLIAFCNHVLAAYKETGATSPKFTNKHIQLGEAGYSRHFLGELDDELHKHSKSYERYFEVLKELLNVSFTKEEFEKEWENKRHLFETDDTADRALQALFDFSIIGFLSTGGEKKGSGYIWKYLSSSARFDPKARKYQVHLGLKEEFGLRFHAKTAKPKTKS